MPGTTSPPAIVTVGVVDDGGGDGGVIKADAFPSGDYMINHHYERDGQTYMAGLTSPEPFEGATVGVFRLGSPTVLWVAEWTACNVGAHPDVPDPSPPAGWVLMDINLTPAMVGDGPSGEEGVYRISGTYVYARLNPVQDARRHLTEEITYPYAPWLKDGELRKVPISSLRQGLLDVGGSTGGGDPSQPGEVGSSQNGQGLLGPTFFVEG